MLEFYQRLARGLFPARWLFWALGAVGVVGFAVSLFGPSAWRAEVYNVLAMTVLLWAALGLSIVHGFSGPLPEAAADAGRAQRLLVGLRRGALAVFALLLSGLALAVAFSTFRTAGMALQAMGG